MSRVSTRNRPNFGATSPAFVLVLTLSVVWQLTLMAFDTHFRQVSGFPLLDLQNDLRPGQLITPAQALDQIRTYSPDTRTLYWVFFTLDNLVPPLVFSAYAVLWASILTYLKTARAQRWLLSPFLWLPFGVGLFDWGENIGYMLAIHANPGAVQEAWMYLGLTFKWVKAACVIPTTMLTLPLMMWAAVVTVRRAATARRVTRHP